jgi:hypothetical protein
LLRIPNPRFKNIRLILEAGQDRKVAEAKAETSTTAGRQYAIVRGSTYYGGGSNEK